VSDKHLEFNDFAMGLIGFGKDIEKSLLDATSPFVFSTVNERSMLRFLKLIACDNGKIGTYAKLVDDRNESAHPMATSSTASKAPSTSKSAKSCAWWTKSRPTPPRSSSAAIPASSPRATTPKPANIPTTLIKSAKYSSTGTTFRKRTSSSALLSTSRSMRCTPTLSISKRFTKDSSASMPMHDGLATQQARTGLRPNTGSSDEMLLRCAVALFCFPENRQ
jgi:hypothetical protein